MNNNKIPVYSIVAFSNTGKTTMLEKLIPELRRRGLKAAVIKHDAHEFEIDKPGKDSWRLTQAGATVTIVASATKAAILENRFIPIDELIARITDVDIILTEGYKHGPWPKIALQRGGNDKPLPLEPGECLAVMTDVPVETGNTPVLGLDDIKQLADLIIADVKDR
jgi:molybdopterin-guanine dinucleotide biosynthesis protein MobB